MALEEMVHALELVWVGLPLTKDLCFTCEDDIAHLRVEEGHLVLNIERLEEAVRMKRRLPMNSVWKKWRCRCFLNWLLRGRCFLNWLLRGKCFLNGLFRRCVHIHLVLRRGMRVQVFQKSPMINSIIVN